MYTFRTIKKITLYSFYAGILVWVILLGFEWGSTYVENQKQASYEEVPFELKLKSAPEDVLFSEAYKTASGTDIVKYAYLAGGVSPILDEDISRRTPVSQTVVLETFKDEEGKEMEKLKTTFISSPQMYQENGEWRQIEYATTTPEVFAMSGAIPHIKRRELAEKILPGESVFAQTSTFYPDPNTETTSVDGTIQAALTGDVNGILTACADAKTIGTRATDDFSNSIGATGIYYAYDNPPTLENQGEDSYDCTVQRGFILFDTSSLPDNAVISAATIGLYVHLAFDSIGNTIAINTSTPASNTALTNSDFGSVGSTDMATRVAISSITTSAYNTFTLNSSGRGQISLTGISKYVARVDEDVDDSHTPLFSGGLTVGIYFRSAEASGTSQDPKLEVTYTTPSTFSMGQWFPF